MLRGIERRLDADEPDLARRLGAPPARAVGPLANPTWLIWCGIGLICVGVVCATPVWVLFGILMMGAFPVVVTMMRGPAGGRDERRG